jgi:hypothetical protein
MDLDRLNRWLGVFANLGVMIGLIFLIFELDQSNRIAERDSRQANARAIFDLSQLQLEMPGMLELRIKLADPTVELSPTEHEQATLLAGAYLSVWGNLVIQQNTDLLPESSLRFGKMDIDATVDGMPGLVPFIEEWFAGRDIRPGQSAPIWNHVWEAAIRNGASAAPEAAGPAT